MLCREMTIRWHAMCYTALMFSQCIRLIEHWLPEGLWRLALLEPELIPVRVESVYSLASMRCVR